jgi:transposase InsO family protein
VNTGKHTPSGRWPKFLGVSSSAYYKWAKKEEAGGRKGGDEELIELIIRIPDRHHSRYGVPRVREAVYRDYGRRVSRKNVARLMRENGLNAIRRKKFIPATNSNHGLEVRENILNREFQAERGGEKWVSDITYLRALGGWVYLTVVLDLFDRKVIGWPLVTIWRPSIRPFLPWRWPLPTGRPGRV